VPWKAADEVGVRIVELFEDLKLDPDGEHPPLYEAVDVEAIEAIIQHDGSDEKVFVQFEYCDETVRVYGDGRIEVEG